MASLHKAAKREPVLWQTLSPSALATPVGSLKIACVLSLPGVLVTGSFDAGTDQRNLLSGCHTLLGGFIRDLHICLVSLSLPHTQFLTFHC